MKIQSTSSFPRVEEVVLPGRYTAALIATSSWDMKPNINNGQNVKVSISLDQIINDSPLDSFLIITLI